MKKTLFTNASGFILSALLFTLAIGSCSKKSAELKLAPSTDEIASAKPGSVTEVLLKVTVRDASGDKITSDGGGDYINGSQNVQATFSQAGNFQFNSQPSANPHAVAIRWLNYNIDSPSQVFTNPPVTSNLKGTFISTGRSSLQGTYVPLQNLSVNQSECICFTSGIGTDLSGNGIYGLNFHRGTEDNISSPTAYMVVTRINSTTWTMTPVGSCSPNSNIAALKDASTGNLYGYYNMPFSFTLTKL